MKAVTSGWSHCVTVLIHVLLRGLIKLKLAYFACEQHPKICLNFFGYKITKQCSPLHKLDRAILEWLIKKSKTGKVIAIVILIGITLQFVGIWGIHKGIVSLSGLLTRTRRYFTACYLTEVSSAVFAMVVWHWVVAGSVPCVGTSPTSLTTCCPCRPQIETTVN